VHATPEQEAEPETSKLLRVLGSVSRIKNLIDENSAVQEFAELSTLAHH